MNDRVWEKNAFQLGFFFSDNIYIKQKKNRFHIVSRPLSLGTLKITRIVSLFKGILN